MERVYYSINEASAKTAHQMMSFSDYKEGSKTAEYKEYVDRAYELADRIAAARPDQADRVYSMAGRYSKRMANYMNQDSHIGCMCPSVMISGPSNFPVRKKEKQNQAWDKNHQFFNETQGILSKMESILHGKELIKSGDEDAVEKLEEKLKSLKDMQELMKAANKAIRMTDAEKGDGLLKDMGYTAEQIKELRTPDFCGRVGYPPYALQYNNANIHRVEGRLKELRDEKEKGMLETENKFFKIAENTETMRLQLYFDGKPDPEVRNVLKSNGFRWAPSQAAWQRQLTDNARYALKRIIEKLEEMERGQQ